MTELRSSLLPTFAEEEQRLLEQRWSSFVVEAWREALASPLPIVPSAQLKRCLTRRRWLIGSKWRARLWQYGNRGLSWRQRLKTLPLLGPVLQYVWDILWLSRFKRGALTRLDQIELALAAQVQQSNQCLQQQKATRQQLPQLRQHIEMLQQQCHSLQEKLDNAVTLLQQARVDQLRPIVNPTDLPANYYLALENHFRGASSAIAERIAVYEPLVKAVLDQGVSGKVVDLGCGRGEWLHNLQRLGVDVLGVDLDPAMAQACQTQGLTAIATDALTGLNDLPAASCAAITSFHLVEHLAISDVIALMRLAWRALAPGGVVIIETPNPENLQVSAYSFYMDPTHRKPLPPPLLDFIARDAGFEYISIIRRNPWPEFEDETSPYPPLLRKLLFCGQDYALVAYRP